MREKNCPVISALVCKYRDQGLHCPVFSVNLEWLKILDSFIKNVHLGGEFQLTCKLYESSDRILLNDSF